jgi:hypothetical protein
LSGFPDLVIVHSPLRSLAAQKAICPTDTIAETTSAIAFLLVISIPFVTVSGVAEAGRYKTPAAFNAMI